MTNPFNGRSLSLSGPATDIVPVTPSDSTALSDTAIALFVEVGGAVKITTVRGNLRTINVPNMSLLPAGVRQVHATGTTATGIHAFVV